MTLLRAAFETTDSDVIYLTVLCHGCYAEMAARAVDRRQWVRPFVGRGECELCVGEAKTAALQ
jgi:hypothetical protein